ncbi:hypothetical protein SAMN04488498_11397 [Mesorhizobium albiziae]|uniref:Uncharacterized protein n=1 Tax=Neomesorhizobium albiziae TaxID=335020 RepID=A0A1I4CIV2_9HYPH|nr:hypothetical protein [Mesorhizobium albiziae]GLS29294.1 hypothetical protein GCM10007937_10020 [Mesorhizobium albiziae]SFK81182.1 hypothetical protein SAMN04488498_11397 [Mesorhizobium albiziae]
MRVDTLNNTAAIPLVSHRKSDDDYQAVVAQINDRWRVIVCKDGIQWILQRRTRAESPDGARWEGRSYLRSRNALISVSRDSAGEINPKAAAILEALPSMIGIGGAI